MHSRAPIAQQSSLDAISRLAQHFSAFDDRFYNGYTKEQIQDSDVMGMHRQSIFSSSHIHPPTLTIAVVLQSGKKKALSAEVRVVLPEIFTETY